MSHGEITGVTPLYLRSVSTSLPGAEAERELGWFKWGARNARGSLSGHCKAGGSPLPPAWGLWASSCTQLNLSHKINPYLQKTSLSPGLLWKCHAEFRHGRGVLTLKVGCTANSTWHWSSSGNRALINYLSLELPLAQTQSLYLILTTFVDINTSCVSFKWRFILK